jgi:hypothetical protein
MRRAGFMVGATAAALLLVAAPEGASAQQVDGWWDWALPHLVEARSGGPAVILPPRGDARDQRNRGKARKAQAGPKFCQNGQGHPVHGRQWCRDKGFGTGGILNTRWDTRGWDDVILRGPRGQDRRPGAVSRGGLIDILGDVIYGRLVAEGSQLGATEPLTGRWLHGEGGAGVLQVRAGAVPVAELTDLNGDGRVNAVLISRR